MTSFINIIIFFRFDLGRLTFCAVDSFVTFLFDLLLSTTIWSVYQITRYQ